MSLHLLLVGVDGLRPDVLDLVRLPHLAHLLGGDVTRMTMPVPTISGPGWSTLLTGASHAEHGVVDNRFLGNHLAAYPDLLSRAFFADPTRRTYAAAAWPPLIDPAGIGPVIRTRDEQRRIEQHRLIVRDGETYGYTNTDAEIATFSVAALASAGPDVSFVYFSSVDEAGHLYGARSDEYQRAAERVDGFLGALSAVVEHRADAGERWLVALTTDHGHLDRGGHGGGEPEVAAAFVARRGYGAAPARWPGEIDPTELTPRLLDELNDSVRDVGRNETDR